MIAVDEAMRRLEIQDIERNAILDAFRYSDARTAAAQVAAQQAAEPSQEPALPQEDPVVQSSKPFTRYSTPCTLAVLTAHPL